MRRTFKYSFCPALAVIMAAASSVSCADKFELDLPLAVSAHQLDFTKDAGSTHILVYSNGDWTAGFDRKVDWGSLNKLSGNGNSDLVFSYSANYGISRSVGIVLSKGELRDTILLCQAGAVSEPSLEFKNKTLNLGLKSLAHIDTPLSTNIPYSVSEFTVSTLYLGEAGDTLGIVSMGEPAPKELDAWVEDIKVGAATVSYAVTENESNSIRSAVLTVSVTNADGEKFSTSQNIIQGISSPELVLDVQETTVQGYSGEYVFPTSANNVYNYTNNLTYSVEYDVTPEENWITETSLSADGLSMAVGQNSDGEERTATVTVTYSDDSGNVISQKIKITQTSYITYEAVRGLPDGVIEEDLFIDGYIVSDRTSANIAQNKQTKQFGFDFTTNSKTAYLESIDGKYGFRLVFNAAEDNMADRWSKVNLSLKGASIQKETDPVRYTISGLTAGNFVKVYDPDESHVPQKKRAIAELTDDDIYTCVRLQNVEILCKDGAYTNCTDGYSFRDDAAGINPSGSTSAPRWDTAPLTMTDYDGSSIYMLTNSYVPWRRDGTGGNNDSVVAQGSGTFTGIVVSEDNPRYGNYGRYQVRAMVEEDIDLNDTPFSNIIAEWTWNNKTADIFPESGSGSLNFYDGTLSANADYNNTVWKDASGSNQKGLIPNAALKISRKWWNFTEDRGNWFDITFSTAGISGYNMIFGIVWGHGDMSNSTLDGPAHWNLLYSIDGGSTFKAVPGDIIKNRSIVWWTTTSQDSCPGFEEYVRKLPDECFNQNEVILRMQVADKVTDIKPGTSSSTYLTNLGVEKGTLTDKTSSIRIGTLTIRYN